MPWKETNVFDERLKFIGKYLREELSVTELCREFGISRKTGHKLIDNYKKRKADGLKDQSRAPQSHPNATPADIEQEVIKERGKHPKWGAAKLSTVLARDHPEVHWPVPSTVGEILKRNGLISSRKRRHRNGALAQSKPMQADAPNATWCMDFKGQFRTGDSVMCYPLTVSDACTRALLRCQAMIRTDTDSVKPILVATFMEHGLPDAIRTDNGAPFASTGLGGLSRLSVWWMRLGIRLDRIDPSHPEQNGRHERMHRVLKEETASPPAHDIRAQQRAFDAFVLEYNTVRPHQGIGMITPAGIYVPSERDYPLILPEMHYPQGMIIRRVRHNGCIRWKSGILYLSESLIHEPVGIDRLDDRHLVVYYGRTPLVVLDDHTCTWLSAKQTAQILSKLREESL